MLEIERKYLIEMPDLKKILKEGIKEVTKITQTYLHSIDPSLERRVRAKESNGETKYIYTQKSTLSGLIRCEDEKEINKVDYNLYLIWRDDRLSSIKKTRYEITYKGQLFELDIYDNHGDKAIVEIELDNEEQEVHMPPYFRVIKEVTEDPSYKNKALARDFKL